MTLKVVTARHGAPAVDVEWLARAIELPSLVEEKLRESLQIAIKSGYLLYAKLEPRPGALTTSYQSIPQLTYLRHQLLRPMYLFAK